MEDENGTKRKEENDGREEEEKGMEVDYWHEEGEMGRTNWNYLRWLLFIFILITVIQYMMTNKIIFAK